MNILALLPYKFLDCYDKNGKYKNSLVDVSCSLLSRIVITLIQYHPSCIVNKMKHLTWY